MKEKEIFIDAFSSEDTQYKKNTSVSDTDFELPRTRDFDEMYASEMPRRRGAAPTRKSRAQARAKARASAASEDAKKPHSKKEKKPSSASKRKKIALIVLCLILLLAFIGSCNLIRRLNDPLIGEDTPEDIRDAQDAVTGDIVTMLLVGADGGGTNTDTIMLAVLNTKSKAVTLISIPRDTRVPNPYGGSGYSKINSVYAAKGMAGLIKQVRDVTGMPINFYTMINFKGFRQAIDVLGGVNFDVPVRMKYSDPVQDLNIDLYPGMQLLDGNKAEQLVRCRSVYAQADLARTEVQRDFIKAVIEQHATAGNLLKLPELYSTLEPYVKTSATLNDAIKYGTSLSGVSSENIKSHMLPGVAGSYGESNVSYFVYDADATEKLAKEIGFESPSVKRIPSPGKPNGAETSSEDVDKDQTIDPEDFVDETDEEDTDNDDTSDKSSDDDDNSDKSSDKNSDKNTDKNTDKNSDKDTEDDDEEDSSSNKPSTQKPAYPDGI